MYHLSKSEVTILQLVFDGETTLKEVADSMGLSRSRITVLVQSLERKGFLQKQKRGVSTRISFAHHVFIEYLKQMFKRHLQVHKLLADSALKLFLTLIIPEMANPNGSGDHVFLSLSQIQHFSGLSRSTINRTMKNAMQALAIYKNQGRYQISPSQVSLKAFLTSYALHAASTGMTAYARTHSISEVSVVLHTVCGMDYTFSVRDTESLYPSPTVVPTVVPTAFTAYSMNGLLFLSLNQFLHATGSGRLIGTEDHIIDTILMGPRNSQYIAYSLLYLEKYFNKIDMERLISLSQVYDLEYEIRGMIEYLETHPERKSDRTKVGDHGRIYFLPHWEYSQYRDQYDLGLK